MRSYAASRWAVLWKLRLPASLPYLFTALKITATASIVGAIVGEGPAGIRPAGAGDPVLRQQYTIAPEKLWAAILVTAALGILFFGIVRGRAAHPAPLAGGGLTANDEPGAVRSSARRRGQVLRHPSGTTVALCATSTWTSAAVSSSR